MIRGFVGVCVAIGVMAMSGSRASAQLTFNITNQGGATPEMIAGFQKAAALWSGVFNDPITINIRVNAAALKIGQIGATSSFFDPYSYTDVRNALMNDRISGNDISSTNALQSGSSFSMLINRTANNPNGVVSATPYFDTGIGGPGQAGAENNSTVRLTTANAKAMGLIAGNSPLLDGTITFTTLQAYDFDRSNGINASQVDFVGVAAHEIGHLLGFYSGVDNLDFNAMAPGKNDNEFLAVTALDLFRFSSRSIGAGSGIGVIDWTADSTPKYISVDGGLTLLAALSTGENFGDGYQASHWKNNLGLGIMDPTISSGEFVSILPNDLVAFDMIGYDLTPTPEPSFCLLLGFLGILAIALIRSRPRPEHLTSTPAA